MAGKKVYAISDSGRAGTARWIAEPLSPVGPAARQCADRQQHAYRLRSSCVALATETLPRCIPKSPRCARRVKSLDTYRGIERTSQIRRRSMAPHCINLDAARRNPRAEESAIVGSTK